MGNMYVTVTGYNHYYNKKPFAIGNVLICTKEPSNKYDSEAIVVHLPMIGPVGYISNSVANTAGGTMSAGRVYDKVEDTFYIRVMFTTQSKIICRVEEGDADVIKNEIHEQMMNCGDWLS